MQARCSLLYSTSCEQAARLMARTVQKNRLRNRTAGSPQVRHERARPAAPGPHQAARLTSIGQSCDCRIVFKNERVRLTAKNGHRELDKNN
jgi:hypothetical protein